MARLTRVARLEIFGRGIFGLADDPPYASCKVAEADGLSDAFLLHPFEDLLGPEDIR